MAAPDLREEARISAAREASRQVPQEVDSPPPGSFRQFTPTEKRRWFQPLSRNEWLAQAAFLGLGALDWSQTVRFTQDPAFDRRLDEQNPILGKNPSRAKVNILIPLGLAAHTLGVYALPRPWRNILQGAGIVGESYATYQNAKQGVTPAMPWQEF